MAAETSGWCWLQYHTLETFQKIANEMGKTPQELNKAMADFSEDDRMSIEIRLREERIRKEEEDTGYTNEETGKPYKRKELILPPLNSEAQQIMAKQENTFPGMRRLQRLPLYAASVITDIKEKAPSTEERRRLLFAFTVECQEAMHAITKFVDLCQNNDSQARNDLVGKYRIWEHKLLQAFRCQWLQLAGKPARLPAQSFGELALEQAQLLFRQVGQMAKIEAEHSISGEFVSRLISVKVDPAKKSTGTGQDQKTETPYEIKLMEQIAEHLKIWFQEDPGDKNYPSGTVDLRLRNSISLAVELVSFDKVLTWLRVNDQKEVARSLEQERDSFLSDLQAVEQAIERGDNPPLELIELRSKITGLIGTLEYTAKAFTDNLTPQQLSETGPQSANVIIPTTEDIAEIIEKLEDLKAKETDFIDKKLAVPDSEVSNIAENLATSHIRKPIEYTGSIEELIKVAAGLDAKLPEQEPPMMEDILAGRPTKLFEGIVPTLPIDELQRLLNEFLPELFRNPEISADNKQELQEIKVSLSRELKHKKKIKESTPKIIETMKHVELIRMQRDGSWPEDIKRLMNEIIVSLFPYLDYLKEKGTSGKLEQASIEYIIKAGTPSKLDDVTNELEKIKHKMEIEAKQQDSHTPVETGQKIKLVKESKSKSLATESQSARTAALLSAAAQLKQIADNFENWAKKQRARFVDPNGIKPPAVTLAKVEDWVNTYLSKQRLIAVFFNHPHLSYDVNSGLSLFFTTESKEFHLIIDVFRLHMPAIATSLKELYDEFWEDVACRIECYKRSKKVRQREQQGDISPSTLIGESADDVSPELQPTLFLDGTVAILVKRLRHIAEMVREELASEKPVETGDEIEANGTPATDDVAESQRKPPNLMALTIIPKHFDVSERTLRRGVKDKKLKKYPDEYGTVFLDTVEVARRYAPLKR